MSKSVNEVATVAFAQYRRLLDAGEAFSAVVRLGELDNYMSQQDPTDPDVTKWRKELTHIQIDHNAISDALAQAGEQLERMLWIMSIGSRFEYEELMLLVTIRTKLELFAEFVNGYGIGRKFDPTRADDELHELAKSREHGAAFRSAKLAAKRNWAPPIVSKWLEASSDKLN